MSRRPLTWLVLALAVAIATAGVAATPPTAGDSGARIVAVYPNPVTDGDAGEFVVLSVPPGTDLGEYTLGDDEAAVELPNRTVGGRVALSTAPNRTRPLVDSPVAGIPDRLALANGGERVRLTRDGRTVDVLSYERAPEGELRVREGADQQWRPLGATERPVVTAGPGTVTAFVLPDGAGLATETLASADRRVLVAGYTLTDRAVAEELVAARERGATVRVLVDGSPVGGMERRQASVLDRLAAAGVDVRVSGGPRARYRFHHAKYAVVDDRALVTTENWKPAGTGGNGSRGWGVVTAQDPVVEGLAETFRADAGWHDGRNWSAYRKGREFAAGNTSSSTYPSQFRPERVPVERTRLLTAPDNAEPEVLEILQGADTSIAVQQVSIGSRGQPFVQATLDAARRGVRVRILLSGAWYVAEENRAVVSWLNGVAEREGLPLSARVAEPRGRYEKIHAKGVIVDGDTVVLGSMNWNNNSARQNREVVLVLEGEAVGAYYQRVFDADWRGGDGRLPVGVAGALALGCLGALSRGRRVPFED